MPTAARASQTASSPRASGWPSVMFSRVEKGQLPYDCVTSPTWVHAERWSASEVGTPSQDTLPAVGVVSAVSSRMNVDLPAPFSPMRATTSPRFRVRSTGPSAGVSLPGYVYEAPSIRIFCGASSTCAPRGTDCSAECAMKAA